MSFVDSVTHSSTVDAINRRFRDGQPSNNLSLVGVIIHQLDGTEDAQERWRPCFAASGQPESQTKQRMTLFSKRCVNDRISASIVNSKMLRIYDPSGPGIVIAPSAARVLCSYPGDGLSRGKTCTRPGTTDGCVPGCWVNTAAYKSRWCSRDNFRDAAIATRVRSRRDASSCAWRATQTREMLESMLGANSDAAASASWNELIIDPNFYMMQLPRAVEAIFYPIGNVRAEVRARSLHARFVSRFSTAQNATWSAPPLLSLDAVGGSIRPFRSESQPFQLANHSASSTAELLTKKIRRFRRFGMSSKGEGAPMSRKGDVLIPHLVKSSDTGVIMCIYAHTPASLTGRMAVKELLTSASQIRSIMSPRYPIELHANDHALALIERRVRWQELWDFLVRMTLPGPFQQMMVKRTSSGTDTGIRDSFYAFVHKLCALDQTHFRRAVFIDADVKVIQPSLIHSLLSSTLRLAEVAMPVDTNRRPWQNLGFEGVPPICSCLIAFHNIPTVRALWMGAAIRLLEGRHPQVRQGDQEMIMFEWATQNVTQLRMLVLPEEYYCPINMANQASGPTTRMLMQWKTIGWPVGTYDCKAIHRHGRQV